MTRVQLTVAAISLAGIVTWASASIAPSATDPFQGSTIDSMSTPYRGGDTAAALFDATASSDGTTGNVETGHFIFADGSPVGTTDFVNFTAPSSVTVASINLFNFSDNGANGANRSISAVRLYELASQNSTVGETLLVSTTSPSNGAGGGNVGNASQGGDPNSLVFPFGPVTGQFFRLEVDTGSGGGPRITELDGVVPEPASVSLLVVSAAGLLARRRRA